MYRNNENAIHTPPLLGRNTTLTNVGISRTNSLYNLS